MIIELYCLRFKNSMQLIWFLTFFLHMKAVIKLVKFPELTVLKLAKLGPWEAGNFVNNSVKISYFKGNIDIVSFHKNFKGTNSHCSLSHFTAESTRFDSNWKNVRMLPVT